MAKWLLTLLIMCLAIFAFAQKKQDYLLSFIDTTSGKELVGFKNKEGEIIIKAKYLAICYTADTPEKMYTTACVYGDGGWVFINKKDSVVLTPYIYDNGPDYIEEGLFRYVENGKIGFANKDCTKVIPAMFDFVTFFENGIAEYYLGGKKIYEFAGCKEDCHWWWGNNYDGGFISRSGQLFIKVTELKNNTRQAWTIENKHVLLNRKGKIIKTFEK